MARTSGVRPWLQSQYAIRPRLLTIGQSYDIVGESGETIAVCENRIPGRLDSLELCSEGTDGEPLIRIKRRDTTNGGDPGTSDMDRFSVRELSQDSTLGLLILRKGGDGTSPGPVLEIRWGGGKEPMHLMELNDLRSKIGRLFSGGKRSAVSRSYAIRAGEERLAHLRKEGGSLGNTWSVKLDPSGDGRLDPRMAVCAALVLDILL